MKSKTQKTKELQSLLEKLPKSQLTVITSFARTGEKGLSVAQMRELKRLLKSLKGEYVVTKKALMDIAFKKLGQEEADVYGVEGSLGLALGGEDAYGTAKKIYEFAKKNQALKLFSAIFDGKLIDAAGFMEMAKMPSKEQLIARLVGMLKYPLTSFYLTLNQIQNNKQQ